MHTTIPITGLGNISAELIRQRALYQMYLFCHNHQLPDLWAYLYQCWYRSEVWPLWARSASEEVPVIRTTMIVESHWRYLKGVVLDNKRPSLPALAYLIGNKLVS
jgi:hypothetical protein